MNQEDTTTEAKPTAAVAPAEAKPKAKAKDSRSDRSSGGRGRSRGRNRRQREPKEFEESILQIDRVTRVTRGGRQLRFRISVVIGDKKGRVGFGIGKSSEVITGIQKAVAKAKQNLITVPSFDGTIPHEITSTYKSSQVYLFSAPTGKGIIAGGAVRKILELSGVNDVLSKIHGSRNRLNVARATMHALASLEKATPYHLRGKESTDVAEPTETQESVKPKTTKNSPVAAQ